MEEVGPALKKIIHYETLRGKFFSVHPDLEAEGITKVEVGEEGLFFIKGGVRDGETVGFSSNLPHHEENEEEMLRRAIAMSLEEQEEELPFGTGLILKDDF